MSHQRYASHDVKEPHSVSLKVLRLSRPSLVAQYPIEPPFAPESSITPPVPASLAYDSRNGETNPEPFILSPILNLPPSFGSAYVGETFSCTLCANHDAPDAPPAAGPPPGVGDSLAAAPPAPATTRKTIRDVRIEAEMKTPGSAAGTRLELRPSDAAAAELAAGQTLQKVIDFDLREEGNHVLAVTVSYYEATETSGRTRTFRKLYQFVCKASLIVRTKPGALPAAADGRRRWVLEAQLENCSEDVVQLERVAVEPEPGLACRDCNWEASRGPKPVLHPGEIEQVCFVVEEEEDATAGRVGSGTAAGAQQPDGRVVFGVLGIGWRGEMGNRGYLSTGKLGWAPSRARAGELRAA